jgi:TIR domain
MSDSKPLTFEAVSKAGRQLLHRGRDPSITHHEFVRWDNEVAEWLDERFPGTGFSAQWSSLSTSPLVSDGHYYNDPRTWAEFRQAVQRRLKFLGDVGAAGPAQKDHRRRQEEAISRLPFRPYQSVEAAMTPETAAISGHEQGQLQRHGGRHAVVQSIRRHIHDFDPLEATSPNGPAWAELTPVLTRYGFAADHRCTLLDIKAVLDARSPTNESQSSAEGNNTMAAVLEVFTSWSGNISREAAAAIRDWLPTVLPGTQPWVSAEDITKGKPWFTSIADQLKRSRVCLICVTPDNVRSPWLFYEAGAIAHAVPDARICPFLIGVDPKEISATPLGQYQCTCATKEDTWRLIRDLNQCLETPHDEGVLRGAFDSRWTGLRRRLEKLASDHQPQPIEDKTEQPVPPAAPRLSPAAKELLIEAAADKHGIVMRTRSNAGVAVHTNGKQFITRGDPRSEAQWEGAVQELEGVALVQDQGHKGEVYRITHEGYRIADIIRGT